MPYTIPSNFANHMREIYGADGETWLQNLPALLDECAQRWGLAIQPPHAELSYNYVVPAATAEGGEVVLKVGVPHAELTTEVEALRLVDGRGAVKLLHGDPARGILLLERLRPGEPVLSLPDEQATTIAIEVMQQFWKPVPDEHPFPTVRKWAAGIARLRAHFDGGTGPFPASIVERAERLFDELLNSMDTPVLLHGDLHHWNILSATRQPWLAIDPKGVVGEPAYEVGAWLRNPWGQLLREPHPERILARRIDQFAEGLACDRERIIGWGIAQAALSGWWSYEDEGYGWEWAFTVAELLAGLPS